MRRGRRASDQRGTVRRLTAATTVGALGLGTFLFVQTAAEQAGPGALQTAVVSAIGALFPAAGLRPPAGPPAASPRATPIAITGGS
jgi:hypothetical protein